MITSQLIQMLIQPIIIIVKILPHGHLFSMPSIGSTGTELGSYMYLPNLLLPLSDLDAMMLTAYSIILPFIIVYKVTEWTYCHMPEILGFGPGPG